MKFSYAIGNPPYQETKGGTKNVDIWPDFLKETNKIANIVCCIHPGRWVIPTKTRQNLHDELINSSLSAFDYYPKSTDVFNNADIAGGISITFFDNINPKSNIMYKVNGNSKGLYSDTNKFFSSDFEQEVYNKVFVNIDTSSTMNKYLVGSVGALSAVNTEQAKFLSNNKEGMTNPIKIWTSSTTGKSGSSYSWYYIDKCNLSNIDNNIFKSRKVLVDKKGNSLEHRKNVINGDIQICDKLSTGDNVLWFFPKNDTDRELQLIKSLFMTKTARYLMCITQKSLCVRGFENVPDYIELAKLLPDDELFTDEWFYKTFDFSKELINEIETRVSPKVEK